MNTTVAVCMRGSLPGNSQGVARMLFCLRTHTWMRLHKMVATGGLVAPRAAWRAEIGLTSRGLEDVGAIWEYVRLAETGTAVRAGAPLLKLDWDGHRISDGDELYHTTWSSIEGSTTLVAPVEGTLLSLHDVPCGGTAPSLEHGAVLAEICVDKPTLNAAVGLVNEEAYLRAVAAEGPGMFGSAQGDDKDRLGYTSYG